jgi:D-arabinose 1-dehydrogenase-like Zn-dependent alcohol dehydrogenase
MKTMLADRLHEIGGPLSIERIPIPEPRPTDVLVAAKACGVVPNLKNVLTKWREWFPYLPLPKLSAILGTGRNQALLDRVKALAPSRIGVLAVGKRRVQEWAFDLTEQEGVDAVIDTLPPSSPSSAMQDVLNALRRGGRGVNIGGVGEPLPLNVHRMMGMNIQLIGSC